MSADLEDGFAADPAGVAETVRHAFDAGLAGCSIEGWDPREQRLYDIDTATERIAAAAKIAHTGPVHLVLTARAENHLRGNPDLRDTIARLQAYQQAGADVLYAPALDRPEDLRQLLAAVELPVNVLARPGTPPVAELAALGVKRISVGGGCARRVRRRRESRERATERRDLRLHRAIGRRREGCTGAGLNESVLQRDLDVAGPTANIAISRCSLR